jgi:A118 family predicted phage portal protein
MFSSLLLKVRGWLYKMGLIKGIKSLSNLKEVQVDEQFFKNIGEWKALYAGYFSEWHDVKYKTIDGPKKRRMATLNMPKVVSNEMASLIFNERCEINISNAKLSENVHDVLKKNSFVKNFQDHLEFNFAMGGMVMKPYVEDGTIRISYITADCFIPISWNNKGITEAVFPNEFKKRDKKYTHLEWHLWDGSTYVIKNEVYESTSETLGNKVALKNFFPDLEEEVRIEGFTRPSFVYIKPNTANNIDPSSPLGISLFANSLDTLKALDIAFDSYQREFKLGRKRILVPDTAIKKVVNPDTGEVSRYFDADDEVYQAMNLGMDSEASKIHDISVSLRVDEHIAAINSLLNILGMQIGFSPGTFTFNGQGVKTATEVISENSKTFKTKKSHENLIEAGLQDLVECIVQLAKLYKLFGTPSEGYEVTIAFDDSIAEDQSAEIAKQVQLVANKLTTRTKAIMKIHGYSEEEAELLVKQINEENQTATAEAIDFFGMRRQGSRGSTGNTGEGDS